jgi:exodeoxyribonuclease III
VIDHHPAARHTDRGLIEARSPSQQFLAASLFGYPLLPAVGPTIRNRSHSSMKIATWNVNSVRSRLERLLAWLQKAQPDVLCLQELKGTEEAFPHEPILKAGYHAAVWGQKTYNGVAILSRLPPTNIQRGMGDDVDDPQARFLLAEVGGVYVGSAYVPNGQVVGSEAYDYKLQWLVRLRACLERRFNPGTPLVICGDFNVARDEKDVARPDVWASSVLFHPTSRTALEQFLACGLIDVFRQQHPEGGLYSWWDYRMLAFPKNDGLRLDYILATEPLAKRCTAAEIDRKERKGEKPSDHAPVSASFDD